MELLISSGNLTLTSSAGTDTVIPGSTIVKLHESGSGKLCITDTFGRVYRINPSDLTKYNNSATIPVLATITAAVVAISTGILQATGPAGTTGPTGPDNALITGPTGPTGVTVTGPTGPEVVSGLRTIKKTIGAFGVAGCDAVFTNVANTTPQVFDLGEVIPAGSAILLAGYVVKVPFVGTTGLLFVAGTTSISSSDLIYAGGAGYDLITEDVGGDNAISAVPFAVVNSAHTHVFVTFTPTDNFSGISNGIVAIYITIMDYSALA
jgi:hypothetical protein